MVRLAFAHLGLHHEAVLRHVAFAGGKAVPDLDELRIEIAELDRARLDLVALSRTNTTVLFSSVWIAVSAHCDGHLALGRGSGGP